MKFEKIEPSAIYKVSWRNHSTIYWRVILDRVSTKQEKYLVVNFIRKVLPLNKFNTFYFHDGRPFLEIRKGKVSLTAIFSE